MRVHWCSNELYDLVEAFREKCLIDDGSLFSETPGVTSIESLDALLAVVGQEDTSGGSFIGKLLAQLAPLAPQSIELCAGLLAFQLLAEGDTGGARKREHVEAVLALMPEPPPIPEAVTAALDGGGVASFSAGKTRRDMYLRFLVRLVRSIKSLDRAGRARVLSDPWQFREMVNVERTSGNGMQANAVLHLIFPDTFDTLVAASHRDALLKTFAAAPGIESLEDDDHRILHLHKLVDEQASEDLTFYDDPLEQIWLGEVDQRFDEYVQWAARIYRQPDFDELEHDYKDDLAAALEPAPRVLSEGGDWVPILKKALTSKKNNLTSWRVHDSFLHWCAQEPEAAGVGLGTMWASDTWDDGLAAFLDRLPADVAPGLGARLSLASVLMLAADAHITPPFRSTVYSKTVEVLQRPLKSDPDSLANATPPKHPEIAIWAHWLGLMEELRLRLLAVGIALRDMLDAQGIAWWIATQPPPSSWDDEARAAFEAFRSAEAPPPVLTRTPHSRGLLPPATPELASSLNVPLSWLQEVLDLLAEKRQIILYGPPGTGKTYLAQHIGEHLEAHGGTVRLVQFHPSYSYEDFFEGYRPRAENGVLTYELVPGPLRRLAETAREHADRLHLLIVDEINRGNLSKIFGELYYLLEYRDREIELQYSPGRPFSLPANLLVVGTMNTADRSIALVDAALRRRFYFQSLLPTEAPVSEVLRRWLDRHGLDPEPADLLDALNAAIDDDDFSVGPSYFMNAEGTTPNLGHIWRHELEPLLTEHFYGADRDIRAEFGLKALRDQLARQASVEDEPPSPDGDELHTTSDPAD